MGNRTEWPHKLQNSKHLFKESKSVDAFLSDEHPGVAELDVLDQAAAQLVKQLLGVLRQSAASKRAMTCS